MKPQIAIIGAGLAGLTLAKKLNSMADITLFEKARGLGGRMSTRRTATHQWDHGAQFFTARSPEFKDFLAPFINQGTVVEWQPNITTLSPEQTAYKRPWFEPHYVAAPAMNSLVKAMASGLNIQLSTEIAKVVACGEHWQLQDKQAQCLGKFDWVISSAPLPQTQHLLPASILGDTLARYQMQPCYALLLTINEQALPHWDAAKVNHSPLSWINFNHRLPGRNRDAGTVIAHSTATWAEQHLEADQALVKQQLLAEFCALTQLSPDTITAAQLHRWRYALSAEVAEPDLAFVLNESAHLAACGDWCLGGRVEAAFSSAQQLASTLTERINNNI